MQKKEVKKSSVKKNGCLDVKLNIQKDDFFIKLFLALVIVAFTLALSLNLAMKVGEIYPKKMPLKYFTFFTNDGVETRFASNNLDKIFNVVKNNHLMFENCKNNSKYNQTPSRIFGIILEIEGNQLTILNNANEEQVVISQAGTVIHSSSTEIGFSSLEEGQSLIVKGILNEEDVLEAQLISVQ